MSSAKRTLRAVIQKWLAGATQAPLLLRHCEVCGEKSWRPLAESLIQARGTLLLHCSEPVGHLYPGKGANTPDKVYRFAVAHPDLKIVAAHWGGGLPFYYLMPEMCAALPNLYFDSAATEYLYDRRVFGLVAGVAGEDRVIFGSDYPLLGQKRAYDHAISAGLSAADPFFAANANTVYQRAST